VRAWIYDAVFAPLTRSWYRAVLEHLSPGHHMLDVGIGTGAALSANADMVLQRDLRIVGLDVDEEYLERCRKRILRHHLGDHVEVLHQPVQEHTGGPYDAVYFSASFMLLPEPVSVLEHVRSLMSPGGRLYFTQTFETERSRLMEKIKPHLHRVTTIEFGRVTYRDDFERTIEDGGLELVGESHLWGKGARQAKLMVAQPTNGLRPSV